MFKDSIYKRFLPKVIVYQNMKNNCRINLKNNLKETKNNNN